MTYKVNADGFLLWCLNRWAGNDKSVGNKIKTSWNPFLDGCFPSSSALLVYPGENGPLSSLRLENFRDGIEDYDILIEARKTLKILREKKIAPGLTQKIEDAINLPGNFVRNATEYNHDPENLLSYRKSLGEILEKVSKILKK